MWGVWVCYHRHGKWQCGESRSVIRDTETGSVGSLGLLSETRRLPLWGVWVCYQRQRLAVWGVWVCYQTWRLAVWRVWVCYHRHRGWQCGESESVITDTEAGSVGNLGLLSDMEAGSVGILGLLSQTWKMAVWGVWVCYHDMENGSVGSLGLLSQTWKMAVWGVWVCYHRHGKW